jgi:hypothetical protein
MSSRFLSSPGFAWISVSTLKTFQDRSQAQRRARTFLDTRWLGVIHDTGRELHRNISLVRRPRILAWDVLVYLSVSQRCARRLDSPQSVIRRRRQHETHLLALQINFSSHVVMKRVFLKGVACRSSCFREVHGFGLHRFGRFHHLACHSTRSTKTCSPNPTQPNPIQSLPSTTLPTSSPCLSIRRGPLCFTKSLISLDGRSKMGKESMPSPFLSTVRSCQRKSPRKASDTFFSCVGPK